ncbi:hypothetical protein OG875_13590 [Streptomyces sp. NBC_01498]|nr:hypothetical protein [Streptomyces sp. NBC_01498]WTL25533.1 hypothetical protein OG875_13590 [Streptomyces sp. NBC_01498]
MNTENERSSQLRLRKDEDEVDIDWVPDRGFKLRKAGVCFDAVRVDGQEGRRLADMMDSLTNGDPGPIVTESNGRRAVYFYLPPGSTANRVWAPGVTRFNSCSGTVSYVPVPAFSGDTWPLFWYCPPSGPDRFVHPAILRNAAAALFGRPMSFGEEEGP